MSSNDHANALRSFVNAAPPEDARLDARIERTKIWELIPSLAGLIITLIADFRWDRDCQGIPEKGKWNCFVVSILLFFVRKSKAERTLT